MKLKCSNCQQQISVDDAKIPAGAFKIKCPKCGSIINGQRNINAPDATNVAPSDVRPPASPEVPTLNDSQAKIVSATHPPADAPAEGNGIEPAPVELMMKREVAAVRRDVLGALAALFGTSASHTLRLHGMGTEEDEEDFSIKKALVCEHDQAFADTVVATLTKLGYVTDVARSTSESLRKIDLVPYDLITVDSGFPDDKEGGSKILAKLNGQASEFRRETFVVLLSSTIKSADANGAFFHGANITVNKEEAKKLEHMIRDGQKRFREIYRVFNRVLQERAEHH